jgi:hypothetical protein
MTVWRIKLNSQRSEEDGGSPDWDEAKVYCRTAGLVGVGWGLSKLRDGARLETVMAAYRATEGWSAGAHTARRLAEDVQDGDLMWTRDGLGRYWLCQISGPWRYDKSPDSVKYDLYNVRPARWLKDPYRDFDVPGAVVRSFTGPGQTLRRVGPHTASDRITAMLWSAATFGEKNVEQLTPEEAIQEIFDPIDIEDLVLLSLQAQGWILLPSTRMHDTPMYEAALRRKGTGELAVVSVKSGPSNPVPLKELRAAANGATTYAFSTHDCYNGSSKGVTKITTGELVSFIRESPELLPPRIARWLAS